MKPKKEFRKRPAIAFDENSRREYLTGFQKRKQQRKRKAQLYQLKQVKDARKKLRNEKKETMREKLDAYGLDDGSLDASSNKASSHTTIEKYELDESGKSSCKVEEHPNHLVIINTNPEFGKSLSALVDEDT